MEMSLHRNNLNVCGVKEIVHHDSFTITIVRFKDLSSGPAMWNAGNAGSLVIE